MKLIWAEISGVIRVRQGVQRLSVVLDDASVTEAVCYTAISGECHEGDRVLLNTTAADMDLGTGGVHFVVARGAKAGAVALERPSGGHIMKLRYTPLQVDVVSVESPESPHHHTMASARSLAGMPVVCCGLHSQVPLVAAAIKRVDGTLRVGYCMTDEAALPFVFSDLIPAATEAGLLDASISCGQAFGGGLEAVNLHSGLLAAKLVAMVDVAVVAIGPGVVGTSTPLGHGGIAQAEAINAAGSIGGRPVACLRVSFADERERHRGLSHHSVAALSLALSACRVALPSLPEEMAELLEESVEAAGIPDRHSIVVSREGAIDPPPLGGIRVTTMGRDYSADPAFFSAAFAAGDVAAQLALGRLE